MEDKFDFTQLPIFEVAQILRRIAMQLLDELIESSPNPQSSQDNNKKQPSIPQLKEYFSKKDIQLFSQSALWRYHPYSRTGIIPSNLRKKPTKALKYLSKKALKGKLTPQKWEIGCFNRLAFLLGGTKADILPDSLWPVAASLAWQDPEFQFSILQKIHQMLRQRQLFDISEIPLIRISPITFWLLIALTSQNPLKFRYPLSSNERAAVRSQKRLHLLALNFLTQNQWAGFWDQWIIRLALFRWTSAFQYLPSQLSRAILELPLMNTPNIPTIKPTKHYFKKAIRHFIQDIFEDIDGIKRLPTPPPILSPYAQLHFTHPQWESQAPSFFSASLITENKEKHHV